MCRSKEIGKRHDAHRHQCRLPRTAQGVGARGRPDGRGVDDEALNDLILGVGEQADPFFYLKIKIMQPQVGRSCAKTTQ